MTNEISFSDKFSFNGENILYNESEVQTIHKWIDYVIENNYWKDDDLHIDEIRDLDNSKNLWISHSFSLLYVAIEYLFEKYNNLKLIPLIYIPLFVDDENDILKKVGVSFDNIFSEKFINEFEYTPPSIMLIENIKNELQSLFSKRRYLTTIIFREKTIKVYYYEEFNSNKNNIIRNIILIP